MLGAAREKLLFDGGQRAQRVAEDGLRIGSDVLKQAIQCACIARLRVAAVGIERVPYRFDQRRFTIKCGAVGASALQGTDARSDGAAQPRGGQVVG